MKAMDIIEKGGVIIFPTDTVYGIGCDPYNEAAIERIYEIKSRERTKYFPVLVYSKEVASTAVKFDKYSCKLAEKFWPGPLTLILEVTDKKLKTSLNIGKKIAIRSPGNRCALKLLSKCNFLVGTSANISGQEPFTDPAKCYHGMNGFDLFLDGGRISGGVPSTIVEVTDNKIRIQREGSLTKAEIMKVL